MIIATFDCYSMYMAELLGDCLYSLSQLHSLPEHEILIVENDASYIEKTLEVVRRYGHLPIVLYKNESNLGMIGNWNRCIDLSKGEYLTLLNDDDLLLPNWSSVMTACLSGKEFTGCRCKRFSEFSESLLHVGTTLDTKKSLPLNVSDLFIGYGQMDPLGRYFIERVVSQ